MKVLVTLGRVLLFWVATMAVLAMASPVGGSGEFAGLILGSLTVPATVLLTMAFTKWEGRRLRDYGFELAAGSWLRFICGLSIGFALVGLQTGLVGLAGGVHWIVVGRATPTMLCVVLGYLLLAAREELAFRGYPFRAIDSQLGPWAAQLIMAALFIAEHRLGGATWENAVLGSGAGALLFGMGALATRGLALPIGLHAAWNIGDWARGGKGDGGIWKMVVDPATANHTAFLAMASYVLVMALALVGLWAWARLRQRRD